MKKYIVILLVLLITACSSAPSAENNLIRIGSKSFAESNIVAELYALALEENGFEVERTFNIAGSLIHTSMINDEIDLYPEYTGTGLLVHLKRDLITDPQEVYDVVKQGYLDEFDIVWLEMSTANDGQGIVLRSDIAQQFGIVTLSDLQEHAHEIRFASQGEFDVRQDALPALEEVYGPFNWKSSTIYSNALKYDILDANEADAAPAYTTEGPLISPDYTVMVDDKQVWPPYHLTPIIHSEVLDRHPEIESILNNISAQLDTNKVIELNAKVDVENQEYTDVAKEFYESLNK